MAKDFLNYEGWTATNLVVGIGVITVDAVVESSPTGCLRCGRLGIFLQKHGSKTRELADIPVRGAHVTIRFERQRYICLGCGATTFQPLPGVAGTKQMTERLACDVAIKAVTEPFVKVAKETGLSAKTIRTVFMEFAAHELEGRNLGTPHSLGIDDVYVDRVARCILVDNDTNGLYELLPRRNITFLNRFLLKIPDRHQVKVVTIDMCAPFRDAVKNSLPNAIVVVDRFHIQRFANEAAKKVARSVRRRKRSGKKCLRDPFLLLRASDALSEKDSANRDRWLKEEPLVYQAYKLKEAFLDLWNVRDRSQAEAAYDKLLTQIPEELKEAFRELMTAMKNWRVEVFNYWDHRYTNATCESHNRIIKDIQRRGQSYDFETVRAKALLRDARKRTELRKVQ
jgi:transposase